MQLQPHAVRSLSTVKKSTTKMKVIWGSKTGTVAMEILMKCSSSSENKCF